MDIQLKQGNITDEAADLVVVNLFQGVTHPGGATGAVDRALGGAISDVIAAGDFAGKSGETLVLYSRGAIPAAACWWSGWATRPSSTCAACATQPRPRHARRAIWASRPWRPSYTARGSAGWTRRPRPPRWSKARGWASTASRATARSRPRTGSPIRRR